MPHPPYAGPARPGDNPHQLTPQAVRLQILAMAGITPPIQAKLVRRAILKMNEKLRATKAHYIITKDNKGNECAELRESPDHMAQLRAAENLTRLMGVEPSKDVNASNVKVIVEVQLPDWARPAVIDVTTAPLDVQVIEDKTPAITGICV